MKLSEIKCNEFINELNSKKAVPGGGGAAALVGAVGVALGGMVAHYTTGKKKYSEYEEDIQKIFQKVNKLSDEFLSMIDEDAEAFLPLSKAYSLPTTTEEEKAYKKEELEKALKKAAEVPVKIVEASYRGILLQEELCEKGSKMLISDVGVGVVCLRSALLSGWLNVQININSINDEIYVKDIVDKYQPMVEDGIRISDSVYSEVLKQC
jgi:formiminotetrahydrofolate cyclodeaminase